MKKTLACIALATLVSAPAFAAPETFTIDGTHTYPRFEYNHLGCLRESLSLDRPHPEGRRGVYLLEFRASDEAEPLKPVQQGIQHAIGPHHLPGRQLLDPLENRVPVGIPLFEDSQDQRRSRRGHQILVDVHLGPLPRTTR